MSAEAIARVVADLRAGRVQPASHLDERYLQVMHQALQLVDDPVVVDAQKLYEQQATKDEVYLYEDHPCIAPPWDEAVIAYVNQHGNVYAMFSHVVEYDATETPWTDVERIGTRSNELSVPRGVELHPLDWDQVKWVCSTFVYIGGSSQGNPMATHGPVHWWSYAIAADGTPLDIHWVQVLPDVDMDVWNMANLVVLGTLNFMNCRNIELVEPTRSRHERRRIERAGVTVNELRVFPVGKTARRKSAGEPLFADTPLSPVRGHFACYGPEYGRGLLFGKHAGRFWIPQHVRGAAEHGEIRHEYILETEEKS